MKNKLIKESLSGAGYSVNGGRSQYSGSNGFGGGGNLAGHNSMYTYEIKPLNRTLEPKVDSVPTEIHITLGTYVKGKPFPYQNTKNSDEYVQGHVVAIEKPNEEVVAYIVLDEKTAIKVRLNPDDTTPVDNTEILDTNDLEIIRSKTNESIVNESSGGELTYVNTAWNKGRSTTFKFDTFKNPASIKQMKPDIKAIVDIEGNLYVVDDHFYLVHKDIIDHFKPMEPTLENSEWSRKEHCYENVICLQRFHNTNTFYLGELYSTRDGIGNWDTVDAVWDKLEAKNPQFKFIKESIADVELNESFKKGGNKIDSLGAGKLKLIEKWLFDNLGTTREDDIEIDDEYNINSSDSILLDGKFEGNLPEYIQFGIVGPWFSVSGNKMTSLRGCPKSVAGSFYCENNKLTSLEYAPKIITAGANFIYGLNKISENDILEYCKKYNFLRHDFRYNIKHADTNKIKNINKKYNKLDESFVKGDDKLVNLGIGKPQLIKKWLDDHYIKNYVIKDDYTIDVNDGVNLDQNLPDGLPNYINFNKTLFYYSVSGNKLTTLKGSPKICLGNFYCDHNELTSLDYASDLQDEGKLIYGGNQISEYSIEKYCKKFNCERWRIRRSENGNDSELEKYENRQLNLNESFIKNDDKLDTLGIGKRKLIEQWLSDHEFFDVYINDKLELEPHNAINWDFKLNGNFPDFIRFANGPRWFSIEGNGMTSLRGCPPKIYESFYCANNKLTSLEFAPEILNKTSSFYYGGNEISEDELLKYCKKYSFPRKNMRYVDGEDDTDLIKEDNTKYNKVNEFFTKSDNKLVNLGIGKRQLIQKWLEKNDLDKTCTIKDNLEIFTDQSINKDFRFDGNFPEYIQFADMDNWMSIAGNKMTTLRGCPRHINGNFYCEDNDLINLDFAPNILRTGIFVYGNVRLSEREILKYCERTGVPRENMRYVDRYNDSKQTIEDNKKLDGLYESLNEVLIGKVSSYNKKLDGGDLYMNPPSIKRFPIMSRAVTDKDGNFFIADSLNIIHGDIIDAIIKYELVSYPIEWDGKHSAYENVVCWMQYGKTNKFYLSESYDLEDKTSEQYVTDVIKPMTDIAQEKNPQYEFILKGIWSV